jgi:hypothetical protein
LDSCTSPSLLSLLSLLSLFAVCHSLDAMKLFGGHSGGSKHFQGKGGQLIRVDSPHSKVRRM